VECKNKCDTSNSGAIGTISKSFRKYLSNVYLTGRHGIKELEKTPILGTAHIHFNMGNNVAYVIYCNYRMAATLYKAETWCVSRIKL
jgi:hypothetical protein